MIDFEKIVERAAARVQAAASAEVVASPANRLIQEPPVSHLATLAGVERAANAPAPPCNRPYRLAPADADRCHAGGWDDAEIAGFVARVALFMRRGINATDADDLAERLTLRDRDGDDRVICAECLHYRPGRCGNHRGAGLSAPDVGRDLAVMLQRCPAFKGNTT